MPNITKINVTGAPSGDPIVYDIKDRSGDLRYGVCENAGGTVAKEATLSGFSLSTGSTIHVKFTYSNLADNPTLNVNSTGSKPIVLYGTTPVGKTPNTSWQAGAIVPLTYNGTSWVVNYNNTDTLVTQDRSFDNEYHPVLSTYNEIVGATATVTQKAKFVPGVKANAFKDDIGIDAYSYEDLYTKLNTLGWLNDVAVS